MNNLIIAGQSLYTRLPYPVGAHLLTLSSSTDGFCDDNALSPITSIVYVKETAKVYAGKDTSSCVKSFSIRPNTSVYRSYMRHSSIGFPPGGLRSASARTLPLRELR